MRASLAAWGPGARLRAPVGFRGKAPGGGPGGGVPGSSCAFQCGYTISNTNLYIRQIVNKLKTLYYSKQK